MHLRLGESDLAELVELGKVSSGLDDVDLRVGTDVYQTELVDLAEQGPALGKSQLGESGLGRLGCGSPYMVGVGHPHAKVGFF